MSTLTHKFKRPPDSKVFGISIMNYSDSDYNLRFLGTKRIKKYPKGLEVSNLFGDVLFDDNKLAHLRSWIAGIGSITIQVVRFQSTNANQITSSCITVIEENKLGIEKEDVRVTKWLGSYISPHQFQSSILDIPMTFIITSWTAFEMIIKQGSSLAITFFPARQQLSKMKGYEKLYNDIQVEYSDYNEKKKRNHLLLR
jgi:NADH/NAD ratio-sensing transcriptional regulator Rex